MQNKLKLKKAKSTLPNLKVLEDLFECLFYSSMCKEESELITVTITFIDPENPDPAPPGHIVPERWSCISFDHHIEMTTKALAKLSKAADPGSSSLAVYYNDNGEIYIWGMIDQAMHYQNFLNYESDTGSEQPGLFQVSISEIGTLNVLFDYELLATLKQNVLVKRYLDVLTIGPISKILRKNAEFLKLTLREYIEQVYPEESYADWEDFLDGLWIQTFSRLLLKIQNYQHGGAILITDDNADLDVKYRIHYERLTLAMVSHARASIDNYVAERIIEEDLVRGKRSVSRALYLKEAGSFYDKKGTADEIKGAISFIASQTCVDGVVLFNSSMISNGFGGVLRAKKMPRKIYVSSTATATPKSLAPHDPKHYGTRHRSMIAYCWNHPSALGLVISQDGDIRAFSKIEDKLIMWENIKTQQYMTGKSQRKRKS
ncbi:putative sensor domain DACNV-containing protein [Pedobacter sp. GSP4]|uniref:putative sensor domain DACNV-containing protein n=1 Tax=Pedobacter sp. GSP4 TaxID=3453716 RepID=UPI003EEF3E59